MALALIVATFISLCGLTASVVYGYWTAADPRYFINHFLLAVTSTFITVLSHSMTMFYFIGSGKWLKEQAGRFELGIEVLPTILFIKKRYFGPSTLTILLTMAATILGGGAHTRAVPGWVHGTLGIVALTANVYVFVLDLRYLAQNNLLMQEVAHRVDRKLNAGEK